MMATSALLITHTHISECIPLAKTHSSHLNCLAEVKHYMGCRYLEQSHPANKFIGR